MTPFPAPGAAVKPPAATPRAQGAPTPAAAGVPRPMRGSYGNNLGAAVRVAPSPTPRMQAPPTTPGIPIARPRTPLAQGAPINGAPRPMVNLGGAPMPSPSPTPRMQAPPQQARGPGIPPNTRAVGAAVPSARPHMPVLQPTQRTPAAASSLAKRELTTTAPAPIQQAKRHAPMPRPQGATTGGVPLPTNPAAPAVAVRAPAPPGQPQGAPTAGNATPSRPPPQQLSMFGVYQDQSKGWMARVMDPKRRVARDIGPFDAAYLTGLAHDRVAIACAGGGKRLNFETAFYRVEIAFLQRWGGDLCDAIEKGEYEKTYAKYLKAGYWAALNVKPADGGGEQITGGDEGGEKISDEDELMSSCYDAELFWDTIEDFFLNRVVEIGEVALGNGGEVLGNRFVEMHRNKVLCPSWRRDDLTEKLKTIALQKQQHDKIQMQQQQQIQMQQQQSQTQPQQHQQQQIQMQQQQQHIQMQRQQQQQQQIQMQQQRQQQLRQQQIIIQKQRQQQMMMAQQQQQCLDDDATVHN